MAMHDSKEIFEIIDFSPQLQERLVIPAQFIEEGGVFGLRMLGEPAALDEVAKGRQDGIAPAPSGDFHGGIEKV